MLKQECNEHLYSCSFLGISCLLDPRFKALAFGNSENLNKAKDRLVRELESQIQAFQAAVPKINMDTNATVHPNSKNVDSSISSTIWQEFDETVSSTFKL